MVRYIADTEEELLAAQTPPAAYLVLWYEGQAYQSFPLRESLAIGRGHDNTMVLTDHKVSRHHCQLTQVDDAFIISDLGSQNGTLVNDVAIGQPTRLKINDVIQIGEVKFLFTASPPPLQAELPARLALPSSPNRQHHHHKVHPRPLWVLFAGLELTVIAMLLVIFGLLVGAFLAQSQLGGLVSVGSFHLIR